MAKEQYRLSMHAMYFKIAKDNAALYELYEAELGPVHGSSMVVAASHVLGIRQQDHFHLRLQTAAIAITFAGMAIEAFLFDYAAEKLGDKYVEDHLDKLDVKSKYLVYPQLAYQKTVNKGGKEYQSLHALVISRNELVHFKSSGFAFEEIQKLFDQYDKFHERLNRSVRNAIACVDLIINQFDAMNPELLIKKYMTWEIE